MLSYRNKAIEKAELKEECAPSFVSEPFVQVTDSEKIRIEMMYPILGMENGEKNCYMRKSVYAMLERAAELLDPGYRFVIWDAWRPFALQKELFIKYRIGIIRDFHLENMDEKEQVKFISRFVADPVRNKVVPPAHTTGGALDLTLEKDGKKLDFGTGFDAFTDKTETVWYESHDESTLIRDNRRMLYHVMIKAGFTNLSSEWWHYEYGDRNWSMVTGKPALYQGVWTKEEFTEMRRQ